MNIKKYLDKQAQLIDRYLDKFLPPANAYPKIIHKAMRYSVFNGGKRLRPILAIEASRLCKGSIADVMPAACAIEMIHAYSLIHDDLPSIDDDDYRRGKPSLHKKFNEAIAILAGDALLSLSFNLMTKIKDASKQSRLVKEVSEAIGTFGMIGGQVADLTEDKKTPRLLKYIHANKTAALITVSLKAGAITAGAGNKEINAVAGFGECLGLSFQIIDDILDEEDYFRVFGMKMSLKNAERLSSKAKAALRPFGRRADTLKGIADFILARKK